MPSSSTVIRANGHVALIQEVRSPPVKTCLAIAAGQYAQGWLAPVVRSGAMVLQTQLAVYDFGSGDLAASTESPVASSSTSCSAPFADDHWGSRISARGT
jgi:hypothetical protein